MVTKNAVFMRSVAFRKRLNKYINERGNVSVCGTFPFSCAFPCVLGTYREKVSQKVSVKVAGGTYVEKVH